MILCDLKMPLMNGIDFVTHIRKAGLKIPVIIITGQVQDKHWIKSALNTGVNAVICKPFNFDLLLKKINDLLVVAKD